MDKLIFLLNTSWQWGLIVGIVWLLVYQLRRAHAICYAWCCNAPIRSGLGANNNNTNPPSWKRLGLHRASG